MAFGKEEKQEQEEDGGGWGPSLPQPHAYHCNFSGFPRSSCDGSFPEFPIPAISEIILDVTPFWSSTFFMALEALAATDMFRPLPISSTMISANSWAASAVCRRLQRHAQQRAHYEKQWDRQHNKFSGPMPGH
eukprot:4895598-Pyramimonas_sp.AAC.1